MELPWHLAGVLRIELQTPAPSANFDKKFTQNDFQTGC